jgi:hypothetical protein
MKICSVLLVFAVKHNSTFIVTDKDGDFPSWDLSDTSKYSLELAQQGLSRITGISPEWPMVLHQAGTIEFDNEGRKLVYIVYTTYFPAKQNLIDLQYKWTKVSDIKQDSNSEMIVRYFAAKRS